jgi:hypothetical protein
VLQLKSPWRDGTTQLRMSPLEFMQRLAALVPRPRLHLIRFTGCSRPTPGCAPPPPALAAARQTPDASSSASPRLTFTPLPSASATSKPSNASGDHTSCRWISYPYDVAARDAALKANATRA